MNIELDPELIQLSQYSLPETLFAYVGMVGSSTAIFSLLLFMVWGITYTVGFFKKIISA